MTVRELDRFSSNPRVSQIYQSGCPGTPLLLWKEMVASDLFKLIVFGLLFMTPVERVEWLIPTMCLADAKNVIYFFIITSQGTTTRQLKKNTAKLQKKENHETLPPWLNHLPYH